MQLTVIYYFIVCMWCEAISSIRM